jgi:xanthine dehydrogenase molybdenum-binding subunit
VWPTTQSIHNVRQLLGEIFDIPLHKVNVKRVAIGGTFGSSIQMNSVIPICVGLALKARRPVKLVSTREEDMYDHVRYQTRIRLKLGVRRDGMLVCGHMWALADIGAHNTQAFPLLGVLAGWWASLYKLPAMKFEGTAVYTNKTPSCAMQGFGNPQATFATESLMDELAHELGMDPIDFKLKNYVGLGGTFWGQGPTVQSIVRSDGVPQLLRVGAERIGWTERPRPASQAGRHRRGIGMARGFHTSSAGAPKPGEVIDYSGALVKVNEDGSVDVVHAMMDHGAARSTRSPRSWRRSWGAARPGGHLSGRHAHDRVRRGDPRHPRRVRRRRGGPQSGEEGEGAARLRRAGVGLEADALVIEPDERLGQG